MIASPAFKNADFRRLWASAACNYLGMSGEQVILGLLVFRIMQSTAWVGAALALYYLPLLIFGVMSGAIADLLDRRTLLRRIELAIAINLAVFSASIAMGFIELWSILVFTVIAGSLRAMYQPARISYAYDIVGARHVVAGLGLLNLGTRLGQLAGALIAGAVMQRLGAPAAFLVLAAAHVVAFFWLSRLRSAGLAAAVERVPIKQNLREYLDEIQDNHRFLDVLAAFEELAEKHRVSYVDFRDLAMAYDTELFVNQDHLNKDGALLFAPLAAAACFAEPGPRMVYSP